MKARLHLTTNKSENVMNLDVTIERNGDLIAADLDGDKVMMDVESGKYFSLNNVGSYVWEFLETPSTVEQVIESVRCKYDVTYSEDFEEEIRLFLTDLYEKGLLIEVSR